MSKLNVKIEQDEYMHDMIDYLGELTNNPDWQKVWIDISHPENPYYSMHRDSGCQYYVSMNHTWAESDSDIMKNCPKHERKNAPMKWARQDLERLYQFHEGNVWNNVVSVNVEDSDKHGNYVTVESEFGALLESDSDESYILEIVKDMIPVGYNFTDDQIMEALEQ